MQDQNNQDILTVGRFLDMVQTTLGSQLTPVIINPEEVAVYLAKKFSVPDSLVRDEAHRRQITEMMQQMAAQAQEGQMEEQGGQVAN